jgi:hypothetical protein
MAEGTVPSWWGTLEEQASKDGVNPDFLRRVGGQESGFKNIGNDTTSASGPFQFIKGTWAGLSKRNPDLGLTNRFDPEQQARGIPRFTKENMDIMEGALGRRISGGEATSLTSSGLETHRASRKHPTTHPSRMLSARPHCRPTPVSSTSTGRLVNCVRGLIVSVVA